jgi:tryptophan 2,3-dioxygenase
MVERTIGDKAGTGSSSGRRAALDIVHADVPDLWAIRSRM